MTPLLVHLVLLAWISYAIASRLVHAGIERVMATAMLLWGHIVLLCLVLSTLGKLGDTTWFFRSSVILGLLSVWVIRRFVPPASIPAPDAQEDGPSTFLTFAVVGSLFVILLAHLRMAGSYPPNNFDSLTYHMPRAMYYLGHNSLAQFQSWDIRQTYFPFNYNLLQLFCFIYSPPHEVINFINVIAWVMAGLGVYRVSRLCGASANGAMIASWLALMSTQVLAQATSTTLDISTAAALFAAIAFGLRWRQAGQPRDALLAGLAFGLAGGAKLTVVFFGPAMVLLLLIFAWQAWSQQRTGAFLGQIRQWVIPGILAGIVALPFIIYNLRATGEWMTHKLDFTLNKPFSLGCALQTAKGYLFQMFFEPFGRFSYDPALWSRLNDWYSQTFFKGWNDAYAYSGFYVIPPDLNEDHVWYGFVGPFFLLCGLVCLWRDRRLRNPLSWLVLLSFGWFAVYFGMNKWSLYIHRYFLLAVMLLAPCAAAVWDGLPGRAGWLRQGRRWIFAVLAAVSLWQGIDYLAENRNRPFSLPGSSFVPPKILPDVPSLLKHRLAGQTRINVSTEGTNERIYLLMHFARNQRFTSSPVVDPEAFNLFSYWGFTRNNIFSNIAHIASYTVVAVPEKKTAGVEFLGTVGEGVYAFDYVGLPPHADVTPPSPDNKNIVVLVHYGPADPDRFAHCTLRVDGLNPRDHARVEVRAELADGTTQLIMSQTRSGEVAFGLHKAFKRLAIEVFDTTTGKIIGSGDLPYATKPTDADLPPPVSATTLFRTELITPYSARSVSVNGLADLEGPYAQWDLPFFRWAKQPNVRIEIPANAKVKRLRLTFNVRLQMRDDAVLRILHNGRVVQDFTLRGKHEWFNHIIDVVPAAGDNVFELRDAPTVMVPDWLAYLDQNPDVKAFVLSQKQPLEQGGREHYEAFGRLEHRTLPLKPNPAPPTPPDDSLYFIYRTILIEGFSTP